MINDYNFTQDLSKIIRGYPDGKMLDFVDHAFSGEAQNILNHLQVHHGSALLLSPEGSGKTHLAFALSRAMQLSPHYLKFDEFLRDCEQRMYRGDNYRIHLHAICNAKFLILDDMFYDGWRRSENCPILEPVIEQIIRERNMYLKPTLFLSCNEDFEKAKCKDIFIKHCVRIISFPEAKSMRQAL